MDHIWKTLGFLGLEILEVCNSHPIAYSKDVLETEIPVAMLGVALLLVSVVCLVACVCCRENQRKGFKEFRDSTHSLQHTGLSFTNPGLSPGSELAIFPPPGVTSTVSVTFEPLPSTLSPVAAHSTRKPSAYRNLTANSLNDDDWFTNGDLDFPRQQLQYLRECGRGWFGRVVEGEARGLGDNRYKVMVRILREDATPAEQKYFLNEAKPYRDLNHAHVLKMVGRCLETNPYLILLEACSAGDLKSFLCGNLTSSSVLCQQGVCMRIMCQVASGLQHMIAHGFVHTDLAARSCLVTSDLTVKVGDYGTSIETYKEDYYIAGDVAVPVRWCAPETLHCTDTTIETKQVTAESNVWSLGVVLWEVCQFGQMPYSELTDDQVIVRVLGAEGMRLPPPTLHPLHANALYNLMNLCWQPVGSRASLDHLLSMLNHLHSSHSEEDFQRRWDALRPNSTPEINLEALTARSDFDSGVDLEIKSADREIIDLVKKSSSDVNMSPCTASPQLSVASSSGGEFFSQTSLPILKKQLSPSLTNLRGSVEDITKHTEEENTVNVSNETEEFDSWLKGVETTNEEDVKFVKKISEAIKDLDDALALEKTSSSSDDSSHHESLLKDCNSQEENPILDFRLGPLNKVRKQFSVQPDSLQDDSLVRRDSSETDTEDETWRGRIERGEFSEKVKEKSKSVTDLMILTHIESESSESDSLPSLTRQYSIDKSKRKLSGTMMTTIGFGSEGNIRGAVLGENFQDALKQLQAEWKLRDLDSRESSLQFIKNETHPTQTLDKLDFLANDASEKQYALVTKLSNKIALSPSIQDSLVRSSILYQNESKVSAPTIPNIINEMENNAIEESSLETNNETRSKITCENALTIESKEHLRLSENSKLSPEGLEISEVSLPTESSSEISTPTQYEVITTLDNIQSFINGEIDHSSSLKSDVIGLEEVPWESERPLSDCKAKLEDSFEQSIPDNATKENSSNTLETICKTICNHVKIVPTVNDSNDSLYEKETLKKDCDILHNAKSLFLNDGNLSGLEINNVSMQGNNNLLSKSATSQELNENYSKNGNVRLCESIIKEQIYPDKEHSNTTIDKVPLKSPNFCLTSNGEEISTFVPEIVVTEASILDIDNDSEPEYIMPVTKRSKRSIKIIMSSSDDSEDDYDERSLEKDNIPMHSKITNPVTSTPLIKSQKNISTEDVFRVDTVYPISPKSDVFVVPFTKETPNSPPNNQDVNTSVILGSCEDYTLDYFKGLKTTFGKQINDDYTDELSKSEEDEEEKKNTSINKWDTFLANTLDHKYQELIINSDGEFDNTDNDLELNGKNKNENITNLNDYQDENVGIIKSKIKFSEDVRKDVIICDRMFENINEKNNFDDHDQQMLEVKNRLEDVAMLSEGFCLKNQSISMDDDEDGKLLTPDDERSSDSGFRDKGSLSESVEDACDEKYNLEDIDAELEEQYSRNLDSKSNDEVEINKTYVKEIINELKEDVGSNDNTYVINEKSIEEVHPTVNNINASDTSLETPEPHDEEKQERLNKLDNALHSDIDHYFESSTQEKSGWYLHPPPSSLAVESQSVSSGWLPSAPEDGKDTSYVSFDIDEEYVTAIRKELSEKLPCAQNPDRTDNEEDASPEEERTDMVIQYNTYPASLSPIFEERESISSNQSSLLLDETGKSIESSGKSSPVLFLEAKKEDEVLSKFEDEIRNALDLCNSESTDSENILVTVEDLENSKGGKAQKVVENPKDDLDDLLIVDTETNKVTLYESPRPRSQLAFIKQMVEPCDDSSSVNSETFTFYHSADDDNMLSVDRNNLTYTPDSVSPLSSGSSRTGAAVSFSSSETCGNLSGFYLSPSSVRSDMFDNGPPSLPFDLGQIYDPVEEIKPNNEAEEIVQELVEAGILRDASTNNDNEINSDIISCGLISSKESSDVNSEIPESETSDDTHENREQSLDSSVEKSEISPSNSNSNSSKSNSHSNSSQVCSITPKNNSITSCDKIDELLENKNQSPPAETSQLESKIDDSKEWLKSVLLSSSTTLTEGDSSKNKSVLVCLNEDAWPKSEELVTQPIVTVKGEPQIAVTTPESPSMDLLEVAAKFYDVNSTLAISTPNNVSFDESKDNSQLSSFTSTPTLETAKCIAGVPKTKEKSVILESFNSQKETIKCKTVPTLKDLANGIVLKLTEVEDENRRTSEDSSPDDSERSRKLQGMTLALESTVVSKAPMPSPEDADKGIWRPTIGQLMELTNQPEQDDMMTTSFIDTDHNEYAPDWESDTSDDSEDHSSSSGEFIWREGDKEEAVRVVIACHDLEPQEGVSEMSMARISEEEGEDDEGEDNSSCASTTEFIPSVWDSNATPTKSALRSAEKPKSEKRNVIFKRQKYHCVYEYPREPSDSEDEEEQNILHRRTWQSPSTFDYSTYADWEYGEGEVDDAESDSDENNGSRQPPESEYDFYRLSNLDFETMTQMNLDDGEFFISSSARPFQMGESSQFFPGSISDDDFLVEFQPCASDTEGTTIPSADHHRLDETITGKLKEVTKKEDSNRTEDKEKPKPTELIIVAEPLSEDTSSAEVSPTLGELRHTRQRLKLDLGRGGVRGEASLLDSGGEDSGVESTATGSSDRLDQVQSSEV